MIGEQLLLLEETNVTNSQKTTFYIKDLSLIFFHTEEKPYTLIQTFCGSNWYHVGILLVLSDTDVDIMKSLWAELISTENIIDRKRLINTRMTSLFKDVADPLMRRHNHRFYLLDSGTTDANKICSVTGNRRDGVKLSVFPQEIIDGGGGGVVNELGVVGIKIPVFTPPEQNTKTELKRKLLENLFLNYLSAPYQGNLTKFFDAWLPQWCVGIMPPPKVEEDNDNDNDGGGIRITYDFYPTACCGGFVCGCWNDKWINPAPPFPRELSPDASLSIFCSELVMRLISDLNILRWFEFGDDYAEKFTPQELTFIERYIVPDSPINWPGAVLTGKLINVGGK